MVTSERLYLLLLAAVALERVGELLLSGRNVRRALARGGLEVGQRHFRAMALIHALFLPACALEVLLLDRPLPALWPLALAGVLTAQALRWWAVSTLGARWSVRIVLVPGESPVSRGPYRLVRHPNYVAVALELLCLPLVHGAWLTALLFSALNLGLMAVRIPAEEKALGEAYARAFAATPRFMPGRGR